MKNSITTRTGDDGTTRLFSGEAVEKDSPRTDAYGDVDELGSILGVARAQAKHPDVPERILRLQRALFVVAAELATTQEKLSGLTERIDEDALRELERDRETVEDVIEMPDGFVLPGGTVAAAHIDHARTVARRCERKVVGLLRDGLVSNHLLLVWFNRLSDYLWLLARLEEGDAVQPKDAE